MRKQILFAAAMMSMVCLAGCGQKAETTAVTEAVTTPETTVSSEAAGDGVQDGIYTHSAKGNNGDVKVEVEVKDGTVIRVAVIEHEETEGLSDKPIEAIPAAIVEHQSLAVDAVSGATNTSNAILEATALCLKDAGLDVEVWKNKEVVKEQTAKEDVTCDTVVVGAGGAGMKVALELAQNGQNVILVEKQAMVGGATNLAATYFVAVDTTFQRESGIDVTIDQYIETVMKTSPNLNEENLRRLLEKSQESLDWLNSLGTKINRPLSNYQVATEDGSSLGATIVKAMSASLDASTVDLRLETEAVGILKEDDAIIGVRVKDAAGEYSVFADDVVIATGGYASGDEAVKKYASDWAGLPSTSAAGSTGEMFGYVEEIGGVLGHMDSVRLNPSVHTENGVHSSLSAARAEGGIIVNQKGLRFCNDYYPDYTTLSKWMMEQEGDSVYVLIDQSAMDNSKRLQGFKEKGYFIEGNTIEELAENMGVPVENLTNTIEKYQKAVETGVDEEFGRTNNLSIDFTHAPFYAVETRPGLQVTLGGIVVDKDCLVQKADGSSFENLYAVGECADDGLFGSAPTNVNITFGKEVAEHILAK
ncbi:MAG: FAD-dependent oxidoreductase [Eubacteriales bacterium]|nr:FAD-dependent oxidoreductase [Eubacteriales bacterium]